MASVTSGSEVERHIHNLEFENEQYMKAIEKEKTHVNALEVQVAEYEAEITALQKSTSQLDEDTKLYHRQFIQNRDSIENLKASVRLSQHVDALKEQYQQVIRKGELEREEHATTVKHYQRIWEEYELQYANFPQAKLVNQAKQSLQKAQENLSEVIRHKQNLQQHLNERTAEKDSTFKPYKTMNELIIRIAEIKVASMRKEAEIHKKEVECKDLEEKIKQKMQEAVRRKQEAEQEAQRQQEEVQRQREIEAQRQREIEAQRQRELEEQRQQEKEAQMERQQEEEKRKAEEQRRHNEEAQKKQAATQEAMQPAPTLKMPPIIAQRGIKLPALQLPTRPSSFMPQLTIPTMPSRAITTLQSPRVPASPALYNILRPTPNVNHPAHTAGVNRSSPTPATAMAMNRPVTSPPMKTQSPNSILSPQVPSKGMYLLSLGTTLDRHHVMSPPVTINQSPEFTAVSQATSTFERETPKEITVPIASSPARQRTYQAPTTVCASTPSLPSVVTNAPSANASLEQTPARLEMTSVKKTLSPPPEKTPKRDEPHINVTAPSPNMLEGVGVERQTSETPCTTPGRQPTNTTTTPTHQGLHKTPTTAPRTPKTPGSDFNIENHLARLKLMTEESPSSGFLYSKRSMFEGDSEMQENTEPEREVPNLPFFQMFSPPVTSKGGGDELPPPTSRKISPPKGATSKARETPTSLHGGGDGPSNFTQGFQFDESMVPSSTGMDLFSSSKGQKTGFDFSMTPSPGNNMNLFGDCSGGQDNGPGPAEPSTNIFSMFGGNNTQEEDEQGSFSFNFGGSQTDSTPSGAKTAFSLF